MYMYIKFRTSTTSAAPPAALHAPLPARTYRV